jgi:hypothetical protein
MKYLQVIFSELNSSVSISLFYLSFNILLTSHGWTSQRLQRAKRMCIFHFRRSAESSREANKKTPQDNSARRLSSYKNVLLILIIINLLKSWFYNHPHTIIQCIFTYDNHIHFSYFAFQKSISMSINIKIWDSACIPGLNNNITYTIIPVVLYFVYLQYNI